MMQAGWLDDVTTWLAQLVRDVWSSFVAFVTDMLLALVDLVLTAFTLLVEAIPVPDFINGMSIGGFLVNLPAGMQWILVTLRIPEGFALLAAGVAFRLLRKLVTVGQW